jgi:carbon-monoxide dehydrogenase small subunit
MNISIEVNGVRRYLDVEPEDTLAKVLRISLGLTGTKLSCERGECGACTVLLNGKAVNSCLVLAASIDGQQVLTIEGLSEKDKLDPLQEAFITEDASQCGYCTPGMILSAKALLLENPDPSEDEIVEAISGNLCRCTGYASVIRAIQRLSQETATE